MIVLTLFVIAGLLVTLGCILAIAAFKVGEEKSDLLDVEMDFWDPEIPLYDIEDESA